MIGTFAESPIFACAPSAALGSGSCSTFSYFCRFILVVLCMNRVAVYTPGIDLDMLLLATLRAPSQTLRYLALMSKYLQESLLSITTNGSPG